MQVVHTTLHPFIHFNTHTNLIFMIMYNCTCWDKFYWLQLALFTACDLGANEYMQQQFILHINSVSSVIQKFSSYSCFQKTYMKLSER